MRTESLKQSGFTIVEVVVTVVVIALFILAFSQLHLTQTRMTSNTIAYNNANLVAYNNLRTYAYGKSPTWFVCQYSGGNPVAQTVLSSNNAIDGVPSPVTQTVVASAPYGCGGGSNGIGYPIKVVSTVTYGPSAKVVVHATYSTY